MTYNGAMFLASLGSLKVVIPHPEHVCLLPARLYTSVIYTAATDSQKRKNWMSLRNTAQRSAAPHGTPRHGTAQPSTPQHTTAHHSTPQHTTDIKKSSKIYPVLTPRDIFGPFGLKLYCLAWAHGVSFSDRLPAFACPLNQSPPPSHAIRTSFVVVSTMKT